MSLAPYREVLRLPGASRLLGFAVLARIPLTASGVVLTLHVVAGLGLGYAAAGVVGTAATLGIAVSSPWRGRMVDRRGLRRALLPVVVGSAACWGVAPFVGYGSLIAVALGAGVLGVPVFGVVRQSLAALVPVDQRRTAYALDSIGTEVSFMIGPAVGVLLATELSTRAALLTVGAGTVLVGLGLMALNPPTQTAGTTAPTGTVTAKAAGRDGGDVPRLLAVLAAALAAGLVLAGTEVGLIAQLRATGALSLTWLVFLGWSGGSVIGGAVYGAWRRAVSPTLLLLWLALLTVPVGLAPTPLLLTATILPAAALCAPLISATADLVSRLVPERARGEAMGWHGAALTVGSALGAPLSGAAIDAVAPWTGFVTVGAVGGALAAVGLVLQRARRPVGALRVPADAQVP